MRKKRIVVSKPTGYITLEPLIRVRITKTPPAPVMDGVDVSGFQLGRLYTVEAPLAHYLVLAGYATLEIMWSDSVNDKSSKRRRRK